MIPTEHVKDKGHYNLNSNANTHHVLLMHIHLPSHSYRFYLVMSFFVNRSNLKIRFHSVSRTIFMLG